MQELDTAQLIALAGVLGWASGVRLYLVVLLTGLAGFMGWIDLPPGLQLLAHPVVLAASGFMVFVEFFADKIPGLDSLWDLVHGVIRIPQYLKAIDDGMLKPGVPLLTVQETPAVLVADGGYTASLEYR